jgi:hypothetical protein
MLCCPALLQLMERQANEPSGNKLDAYEIEAAAEKSDALRDLAEFQLAVVSDLAYVHHLYLTFT